MGGSSGGPFSYSRPPEKLQSMIRRAEEQLAEKTFLPVLQAELTQQLSRVNSRDSEDTRAKLDALEAAIQDKIDGSFDFIFGGSVAKHTYVDGLSDVDALLVIDESEISDKSPRTALAYLAAAIAERLGGGVHVSTGQMAVTVVYDDGQEVQLLPALRTEGGKLKVPSSRTDGWSEIDPDKFAKGLTKYNDNLGGKLVPTIKLAKAIIGQLPKKQRLSGYHVESLAIAALKDYVGPKTVAHMLPALFEKAPKLVLKPITDSTGQSVHVDGYLGAAGSNERQVASHVLDRLSRRMRNASAAASIGEWQSILGSDAD